MPSVNDPPDVVQKLAQGLGVLGRRTVFLGGPLDGRVFDVDGYGPFYAYTSTAKRPSSLQLAGQTGPETIYLVDQVTMARVDEAGQVEGLARRSVGVVVQVDDQGVAVNPDPVGVMAALLAWFLFRDPEADKVDAPSPFPRPVVRG